MGLFSFGRSLDLFVIKENLAAAPSVRNIIISGRTTPDNLSHKEALARNLC